MRVGAVRVPWARPAVAVAAALTAAMILLLARGFNFYFDEWDFILAAPDWTWVSYLQPHNGHPAMIPKLAYAVLLNTVGLREYWPYMALLALLHAVNAVLLFELMRRRSGDVIAMSAAALLLVLGAGWENLLWAFQISFVGSVACGLGALLLLEQTRSRASIAATVALLTAGIMFSAIGLFFAIAAVVRMGMAPDRRRDLIWLAPLGLAVAVWYATFGRSGAISNPPPGSTNLLLDPIYVLWGLGTSAAGVIGEGGWWAPPALLAGAAALAWAWWPRRPDAFALSVGAAALSFYVVTGLTRAQFGYDQSGSGRYVYEGAIFWLLLLGDAARLLPWRGTWRPALIACVFLACFNSGALLYEFAVAKTSQMQREGADLQALNAERGDVCLDPGGHVDMFVMPQVGAPALYYSAVDLYGDPAPALPVTDEVDYGIARGNLERVGCR